MTALNPASLRAACRAMHEAYRPDAILLRPDAMEAAITAFLAAEAERGMAMRPRAATAGMMEAANAHPVTGAVNSAMVIAAVHGRRLPDDDLTPLENWWTAMWDAGAE